MKLQNLISNPSNPTPNGMTLIELLVVLGILAALAGMTLSFVGEMNTAARQTVTRNKLDQIEAAVAGTPTHSSRFLNDIGRLPVTINENGKDGIVLSELWNFNLFDKTTNDPAIVYHGYDNEITQDTLKSEGIVVRVNGGWKGPYLNVTNQKLYDGFGNDFYIADPEASGNSEWNNIDEIGKEFILDPLNEPTILKFSDLNLPPKTILKFGSFGENDQFDLPKDSNQTTSTAWQNSDDIKTFHYSQVFSTLHINFVLRDFSTNPITWLPVKFVEKELETYDREKAYAVGSFVKVSSYGDNLFICTYSPSSTPANAEPEWNFTGITTDDQGRKWVWLPCSTYLNRLRVTVFSPYVEHEPNQTNQLKSTLVRAATAFYSVDSNSSNSDPPVWKQDLKIFQPPFDEHSVWNNLPADDLLPAVIIQGNEMGKEKDNKRGDTINEITFRHLTPGIRKIFAYGFVKYEKDDDKSSQYFNARHSNVQTIELKPGENFITIYLHEFF